jgi:hypothetical protein
MKCANCYDTVAGFLGNKDAVIATLQARVVELERELRNCVKELKQYKFPQMKTAIFLAEETLAKPTTTDTLDALIEQRISERFEVVAKIVHTIGTGRLLEGRTIPKVMLDIDYLDLPEHTELYAPKKATIPNATDIDEVIKERGL